MSCAHRNSHGGSILGPHTLMAAVGMALILTGWAERASAQSARTVADFNGDGVEDLAIGAPGANGGRGSVSIFLGVRGIGFASSTPTVTITGTEAGEQFGFALAAADFNRNGWSELAVGTPDWNHDTGKVNVIQFISWAPAGAVYSSAFYIQNSVGGATSAPYDRFGAALATGNFDGDRYPDLAIGVPGDDLSTSDAGSVNILYGSRNGLRIAHDPWWRHHWFDGTAGTGDRLGHALAAGDFNADGIDDLAVGAPLKDAPRPNSGAVMVINGTPAGLGADYTAIPTLNFDAGRDQFGFALAAGDFDRDGIMDLAIGAPTGNFPNNPHSGYMVIKYGSFEGLISMLFEPQESRLIQPGAMFGWSLAAADFTGDGYDDIAVGAPLQDIGGIVDAGAVIVFYGGARYYFDPGHVIHQNSYHVRDRSESGDGFGASLTAGDFNGDGLADLAAGVPYKNMETTVTRIDAGAVAVVFGGTTALTPEGNVLLVGASREAGARFGSGLSR